jgi:hypothetical protein
MQDLIYFTISSYITSHLRRHVRTFFRYMPYMELVLMFEGTDVVRTRASRQHHAKHHLHLDSAHRR